MRAIHKAKEIVESAPDSHEGLILGELVLALESGDAYPISQIYELEYKHFELAIAVIADWRLDRHYAGKFRLISAALHARTLQDS